MSAPETPVASFWSRPLVDLFDAVQATPAGLTSDEASQRRRRYGPNTLVRESRFAGLAGFLRFLLNPLVIILLVASVISLVLGDSVGGLIIISMVLLSVLLNLFMEFQARQAVEAIRNQVATTAAVTRDRREQDLPIAELVSLVTLSCSMSETSGPQTRVSSAQRTCTYVSPRSQGSLCPSRRQ
jgi:P-type Mg2+ transporter